MKTFAKYVSIRKKIIGYEINFYKDIHCETVLMNCMVDVNQDTKELTIDGEQLQFVDTHKNHMLKVSDVYKDDLITEKRYKFFGCNVKTIKKGLVELRDTKKYSATFDVYTLNNIKFNIMDTETLTVLEKLLIKHSLINCRCGWFEYCKLSLIRDSRIKDFHIFSIIDELIESDIVEVKTEKGLDLWRIK